MSKEYIEVEDAKLKHGHTRADLFLIDGRDVWIPRSLMEPHNFAVGEVGSIYVQEWFCNQEGL